VGSVQFEWDAAKESTNRRKHGISFEEAIEAFEDPLALVQVDSVHPDRMQLLGESRRAKVLFVVYIEKLDGDCIRIISARKATAHERRSYAHR
jgi:uncharacterized DUF497 family protein